MKKFLMIFIIFLISCSNREPYKVSIDSVTISPESLLLTNYSGESISLKIENPTAISLVLVPDISLYTKVDGKEYLIQRKNEINIKPSASFSFSIGGEYTNNSSIGITIESSKEYLFYNQNEFIIEPLSQKNIYFSINTNNLYFTKDQKNFPVNEEEIYGHISIYYDSSIIKSIPFKLTLYK